MSDFALRLRVTRIPPGMIEGTLRRLPAPEPHPLGGRSSNTVVTDWWRFFPSKAMAMAFSDRLLDGAQDIRLEGAEIHSSDHAVPAIPALT